jgi:alpha-L-rhamnosidase
MLPRSRATLALAVVLSMVCHAKAAPPESLTRPLIDADGAIGFRHLQERGYTPLFNGRDLTGWRNPYPFGEARVVDGEIHLRADKKFFLVTEKAYSDFRLSVEIRLPEGPANSGVMFRCHVDDAAAKKVFGYQAECDGSERCWSGGLYDEARRGWIWPSTEGRSLDQFLEHAEESQAYFATPKIRDALDRDGWNRFEVTCQNDLIRIELNGIEVTRFRDATDTRGFIAIQHHGEAGQTYRFRNLFIKELPEIPATEHVSLTEQEPVAVTRLADGTTLLDFGKVAFGNVVMPVPEGRGSASVHFGEKLKDGRIDRSPPGTVRYGFTPIRLGDQRGTWVVPAPVDARTVEQAGLIYANPPAALTPRTWGAVMPFRWAEIEGLPEAYPTGLVRRRAAFSNNWDDAAASFACSDPLLTEIWDLCKYSIKATTFAGIYVDGDRERIPYEGDAFLNQLSHYATDSDLTMARRTFDWLMENGTWPTEWSPHMVFMAHADWMHTGDAEWLRPRYESLKRKTLLDRAGDDGFVRSNEAERSRNDLVDWPQKERDGFVFTEVNTVVNAFHLEALRQMAVMARGLGNDAEADAFAARAALAHASFQEQLFDREAGLYRDGIESDHSSLHANFFPLAFGLVPDDALESVLAWLSQQDMRCSVYAAQYFLDGLLAHGSGERARQLILADGDRSWKHMLESGTTITWEAWEMKYKPNQDWNHAWGAAPANLLPRYVLGVRPALPGWQQALVRPELCGLASAEGTVPTPRGPIAVKWSNEATFRLSLTLPEGMSATIDLPVTPGSTGVFADGEPLAASQQGSRWIVADSVGGSVTIEVK